MLYLAMLICLKRILLLTQFSTLLKKYQCRDKKKFRLLVIRTSRDTQHIYVTSFLLNYWLRFIAK
jgi:hypothetical protein